MSNERVDLDKIRSVLLPLPEVNFVTPDGWEIDIDQTDEGGQPNGAGTIEPSDYREWYTDERESHHRRRVTVTLTGPWEDGPTDGALRAQEQYAKDAAARMQAEEERILAKAEEIKARRDRG